MTTSFRILCYAKSSTQHVYMHEKDTVCGLIDLSFSYCFYRSGLVVLLTPIYPGTYTAFAINAYCAVIVKNRSNVFTPGERCLPTLLRLLRNLDSQLASSSKFQGGEEQTYGSGKSIEVTTPHA